MRHTKNIANVTNDENTYYDEEETKNLLDDYFTCDSIPKYKYIVQRGQYYAIFNFVQAEKEVGCTETITLTAPGDYRFLDNVAPLVERWRGPVSIALYAPGHDFYTTLQAIAYVRQCENRLIKDLVSFHVFFDINHVPIPRNETHILDTYTDTYNCSIPPPWETLTDLDMYKTNNSLLYPINTARNIAKLAARTYFQFPSDIELYPTRNFIQLFLNFVKNNLNLFGQDSKNVFVLPIFEIFEDQAVPENKTALQKMLKSNTAILFHQKMCALCHRVINGENWVLANETKGLGVFSVGKRQGRYMVWEPFFICTQKEPLWDERMTWEGQKNKMIQAYTMCIMDYNFYVLDNAFLIHKPGIKKEKLQMTKFKNEVKKSNQLIVDISVELQRMYGENKNCSTSYKGKIVKVKVKKSIL